MKRELAAEWVATERADLDFWLIYYENAAEEYDNLV